MIRLPVSRSRGLGQQPSGVPHGLVQLADQAPKPSVGGSAGQRPVGVARHGGHVAQGLPGESGHLPGQPVDLGQRHPGASPQGLGQQPHPPARRPAAVAEPDPGRHAAGAQPPDQPTGGADGPLQQVGVGREVDVGLDDGGVDAQLTGAQQLVPCELAQQRRVELGDRLGAGPTDQLDQGGRVRHGLVQRDPAEPSPADRVADLPAQALVAKAVAMLEVQQPQQGGDRDRRAAQPGVKQRPPRRAEPLVVQVGVDLGQLGRQPAGLLGQHLVPGGHRRANNAKHHDHRQLRQQRQACRSATTSHCSRGIPAAQRSNRTAPLQGEVATCP